MSAVIHQRPDALHSAFGAQESAGLLESVFLYSGGSMLDLVQHPPESLIDPHLALALITAAYLEDQQPFLPAQLPDLMNLKASQHQALAKMMSHLVQQGFLQMEGLGWVPSEDLIAAFQRTFGQKEAPAKGAQIGQSLGGCNYVQH